MKPIKTEPLTRTNSDGKPYQRTLQVESQIVEALALDESELAERLDIRDFKTEGYFQEECLVHLIRRCHREDCGDMVNKLTERLIQRCARHINDRVSFSLDSIYVDDCFREVIAAAFGQILDLDSNHGDFAQVRFWLWLDRVISNVMQRYWKRQRKDWVTDSIDCNEEEDEGRSLALRQKLEAVADKSSLPDWQFVTADALRLLNPKERHAFLLRYYAEWEIENQTPRGYDNQQVFQQVTPHDSVLADERREKTARLERRSAMKNTREKISLDDVLDYYLISTEETGRDILEEVVRLYPQYELELRELAADQKIFGRIPPREYAAEEEQLLTMRAVSVVQNLLYQRRQEKASDATDEESFTGVRDEIEKRYASAEEFYEKTWLSEGITWTLDDRQVRFKSIPQKAIENIANALGRFVSTISEYLQGGMLVAPSHYKAEQAPEVSGLCDFSDLVRIDPDLSEERKEFWLSPKHKGDKQE